MLLVEQRRPVGDRNDAGTNQLLQRLKGLRHRLHCLGFDALTHDRQYLGIQPVGLGHLPNRFGKPAGAQRANNVTGRFRPRALVGSSLGLCARG